MSYLARKTVKFDRLYSVGEVISNDVIDPKRLQRLLDMGKISPLSATVHSDSNTELEQVEQLAKALELEVENHKKTSEKLAKEKETTKKLKAEAKALKAEISALTQVEEEDEKVPEESDEEELEEEVATEEDPLDILDELLEGNPEESTEESEEGDED